MTISKNAVAILVVFLGFLGVDVTDNMVLEFVGSAANVIEFVTLVYHQIAERYDTSAFFFKK